MKKIHIFLAAVGLFFIAVIGVRTYNKIMEYRIQKEIAGSLIRFHVRANSDSKEDQALKLKVKDRVVKYLEEELKQADTLDGARNILYYGIGEIEEIALSVIREEGFDYPVKVYFENDYFPLKTYGDMVFPAGEYEAFRIDIGGSEGKNWWCVLYPPLCFVDSTYAVVPDSTKGIFQNVLSEEAYSAITVSDLDNVNYEVRFKYLTFLNKFLD